VGDEPTPGEVSRALDRLRADIRDDLNEVRTDLRNGQLDLEHHLDRTVSREVYLADRRTDAERFRNIEDQLKAFTQAKADRATNRKWVIAAVLIPIGVAILEVIFTIRGVR
jgi:hypothetical protein